jgi:predicted dehydrogenase/threonine dehydrogenase-like Zn-dependent dehydrogenase
LSAAAALTNEDGYLVMKQLLMNSSGVFVARVPVPALDPDSVLVKVHYSLVSTGTEIASLRPVPDAATPTERAQALTSKAVSYLGKAARDPRKAADRASKILRRTLHKHSTGVRKPAVSKPVQTVALQWRKAAAHDFTYAGDVLELTGDDSAAAYQCQSQPFSVPVGYSVEVSLRGKLMHAPLCVGLLNEDQSAWIGQRTLEPGEFDECLQFNVSDACPQVTLVIANSGAPRPADLRVEAQQLAVNPPDESGLPANEMDDQGWNVGYSVAGDVIAVGDNIKDIVVGTRVACGGAGQANHAEYVCVKRNLVCQVPDQCDLDVAATTTVGAIALQGVRRAQPQLGETTCVIGLGLIGMITLQLLRANGCRVIGLDLDPRRVELAGRLGALAATADPAGFEALVHDYTTGQGADQTIITAASKSDVLINQAMQVTRRKGRVVLVGDVGLKPERAAFYRKEIDLLMSTSYGPGRYDREYEEHGHDYPYAYVRWTQNRNMQAFLDCAASGAIDVKALIQEVVAIDEAPGVYQRLAQAEGPLPLAVLFRYPEDQRDLPEPATARKILLRGHRAPRTDRINYVLVGVGGFGTSMLVPQMDKLGERFFLRGVVSRDAARGGNFARGRNLQVLASDYEEVLADPDIDLLVIATRHHEHAEQVARALAVGKHVFVEKPLALDWEQLDLVRYAYESQNEPTLLMVGFNRRFSPAVATLRSKLSGRRSPMIIHYRLNGGYIPPDSWIQDAQGGGRNLGEACHMYDVFRALVGVPVRSITATSIDPGTVPYLRNDNFVATLTFEDGSVANLVYTALGPKQGLAKERMEVFCDGNAFVLDDYTLLQQAGESQPLWRGETDKGHFEELRQFGEAIAAGGESPIPFAEIVETTAVSLHVEDQLHGRIDV